MHSGHFTRRSLLWLVKTIVKGEMEGDLHALVKYLGTKRTDNEWLESTSIRISTDNLRDSPNSSI